MKCVGSGAGAGVLLQRKMLEESFVRSDRKTYLILQEKLLVVAGSSGGTDVALIAIALSLHGWRTIYTTGLITKTPSRIFRSRNIYY